MQVINQGEISNMTGVVLSADEYFEYRRVLDVLEVLKSRKQEYDEEYKP